LRTVYLEKKKKKKPPPTVETRGTTEGKRGMRGGGYTQITKQGYNLRQRNVDVWGKGKKKGTAQSLQLSSKWSDRKGGGTNWLSKSTTRSQ